jgi:penicillin amidase
MRRLTVFLIALMPCAAEDVRLSGLEKPVEVLRDRWGVPHIYAQSTDDLFFAQGYMASRDRLFQLDLWRRMGTGKLAEVLGPQAVPRDRVARLLRFRGDWNVEWQSYSPDARQIATAFANGINAYIRSLNGKRPIEFKAAGYDPGLWTAEDCTARVAALGVMRNVDRELARALATVKLGVPALEQYDPPDPFVKLDPPKGLKLDDLAAAALADFRAVSGIVSVPGQQQGSNNWVVDGTLTASGKPLLANDPHRPFHLPSLRRTVHLVGPGWNAMGAGEPALPGIALGHNEEIAFGFTIVGVDQQDLFVERLNPNDAGEYMYRGAYRKFDVQREGVAVKGASGETLELKYSVHGPILYEDRAKGLAYALKWVGAEPGTAGYLAALAVARAKNWNEFRKAMDRYRVPSENMIYADRSGNIGWIASGMAPLRKNWTGLYPVPGDTGEYEWSGFLPASAMPSLYNPANHYIATANHNILPSTYKGPIFGYEWAAPFRFHRVEEMLAGRKNLTVADFQQMQLDVVSLPARQFQGVVKRWEAPAGELAETRKMLLDWDARMDVSSAAALIYEFWIERLALAIFGADLAARVQPEKLLEALERSPYPKEMEQSLSAALRALEQRLGPERSAWRWGSVHKIEFQHALQGQGFERGPLPRPGNAHTVNAAGGGLMQTSGASYRQVIDLSDWDRSVMTNVPGEVGNPESPHYSDLLEDWNTGRFHPMPYTRKAVEAATTERIRLMPSP